MSTHLDKKLFRYIQQLAGGFVHYLLPVLVGQVDGFHVLQLVVYVPHGVIGAEHYSVGGEGVDVVLGSGGREGVEGAAGVYVDVGVVRKVVLALVPLAPCAEVGGDGDKLGEILQDCGKTAGRGAVIAEVAGVKEDGQTGFGGLVDVVRLGVVDVEVLKVGVQLYAF